MKGINPRGEDGKPHLAPAFAEKYEDRLESPEDVTQLESRLPICDELPHSVLKMITSAATL